MAHSCGLFCVVDVAECATAMKYVVPGGRTPSGGWLLDLDGQVAYCLLVGCVLCGAVGG